MNLIPGYKNTMTPLDEGKTLAGLVRMACFNIDLWDEVAMDGEQVTIGRHTHDLTHGITFRRKFAQGLIAIARARGWTAPQMDAVFALYKRCPPNALYRVRGGYHSLRTGQSPLGIIVSYKPVRGAPAQAGIAFLGFKHPELGCLEKPFGVPAEGLEDVTAAAYDGTLLELKYG